MTSLYSGSRLMLSRLILSSIYCDKSQNCHVTIILQSNSVITTMVITNKIMTQITGYKDIFTFITNHGYNKHFLMPPSIRYNRVRLYKTTYKHFFKGLLFSYNRGVLMCYWSMVSTVSMVIVLELWNITLFKN